MKDKFVLFLITIELFYSYLILRMPHTVPVHWDQNFQIDAYGSKYTMFLLVVIPFVAYYGMRYTKKIDKFSSGFQHKEKTYDLMIKIIPMLFVIMGGFFIYMSMNPVSQPDKILGLVLGLFMIIIGNYMPRLPRNQYVGIKFSWNYKNDDVWRETHRISGYLFVLDGLLICLWSLFGLANFSFMLVISLFVIVIVSAIVSYKIAQEYK